MTANRKQYLKLFREKNKDYLLEYARKYNKIYYNNKKAGIKTPISIHPNKVNENSTHRICAVCKIQKKIEDFPRRKDKPLGRIYRCFLCYRLGLKKYSFKNKVRSKLRKAVKAGKIKKLSCKVCQNIKSEAHHFDYTKPLDVVWLCRFHHDEEHKKIKAGGIIIME